MTEKEYRRIKRMLKDDTVKIPAILNINSMSICIRFPSLIWSEGTRRILGQRVMIFGYHDERLNIKDNNDTIHYVPYECLDLINTKLIGERL